MTTKKAIKEYEAFTKIANELIKNDKKLKDEKAKGFLIAISEFYDKYPINYEMDILTKNDNKISVKVFKKDFTE